MYNPKSSNASEFIDHEEVTNTLAQAMKEASDPQRISEILAKAQEFSGLTHQEAAVLLQVNNPETLERIFSLAREVKEHIYGRRIVMFAPLYLSDFCVNTCTYCGYNHDNQFTRHKLTQEELIEEVRVLESMGHKRLALETGEDPVNSPIDYVLECMATIYAPFSNFCA